MTSSPTRSFADALRRLESDRDVDGFVAAMFADDAQLARPETSRTEVGRTGATQFWQQYLDQFAEVRSEFDRVVDGAIGVLEWTSRGRLSGGVEIEYRGVSLLGFTADGRVSRFATYYDTAPFQPR